MSMLPTARAVLWVVALCATPATAAVSPQSLNLERAFERALAAHPDVRRIGPRRAALAAETDVAAQRPALVVGASLENVSGSGEFAGFDGAELSFTLGSVLEPREKREARVELVRSRLADLEIEEEARRLDLLADVARRYLDVASAQADLEAARIHVAQRERTVAAATKRVAAGASPLSTKLSASAAQARAELDQERSRENLRAARRRLALAWGETEADFDRVSGDLMQLPALPAFAEFVARLERTPELQRFATETRVREARLQLARSARRPDLEWQVGVRRLQESADTALIGSVSVPLGSRLRAQPAIRAAEAELDELRIERESGALGLRATLAEADGRLRVAALAVARAGSEVLPALREAEVAAADAYRAGALSQLEWAQLQSDQLAAERERIAAARDFHLALIEIQRLTAQPFVLATGDTEEFSR